MKADNSKSLKGLYIVLLSIPFVFVISLLYYNLRYGYPGEIETTHKLNKKYFDKFNYSFSCIVTNYYENRESRGDHFAVVTIDLRQTDIENYDPSDTTDIYFCLIKDREAKVMIPVQYDLERKRNSEKYKSIVSGDSLVFDGLLDRFSLYFDQDSTSWTPKWLSTDSDNRKRKTSYLR